MLPNHALETDDHFLEVGWVLQRVVLFGVYQMPCPSVGVRLVCLKTCLPVSRLQRKAIERFSVTKLLGKEGNVSGLSPLLVLPVVSHRVGILIFLLPVFLAGRLL